MTVDVTSVNNYSSTAEEVAQVSAILTNVTISEGGSSNYNELTNKPSINSVTLTGNKSLSDLGIVNYDDTEINARVTTLETSINSFSNVATTGDYEDLVNKPTLFSGDYNDLTNKPSLFSGDYEDLTNKPSLFSGDYDDLTNKPTLFDGDYDSLTNKPELFDGEYDSLSNKPTLANVATSGDYNDLTNVPTITNGNTVIFDAGVSYLSQYVSRVMYVTVSDVLTAINNGKNVVFKIQEMGTGSYYFARVYDYLITNNAFTRCELTGAYEDKTLYVYYDTSGDCFIAMTKEYATATNTTKGIVKVDGTSITIDSNGTISSSGGYELPTASTTTLGGVKIDGDTITIDENGVISSSGGGGGGSSNAAQFITHYTSINGTKSSSNVNYTYPALSTATLTDGMRVLVKGGNTPVPPDNIKSYNVFTATCTGTSLYHYNNTLWQAKNGNILIINNNEYKLDAYTNKNSAAKYYLYDSSLNKIQDYFISSSYSFDHMKSYYSETSDRFIVYGSNYLGNTTIGRFYGTNGGALSSTSNTTTTNMRNFEAVEANNYFCMVGRNTTTNTAYYRAVSVSSGYYTALVDDEEITGSSGNCTSVAKVVLLDNGNIMTTFNKNGVLYYAILNPDGTIVSQAQTVSSNAYFYDNKMMKLSNGNVFITGSNNSSGGAGYFTILDSSGNIVKSPTVIHSAFNEHDLIELENDNILLAGCNNASAWNSMYYAIISPSGTFVVSPTNNGLSNMSWKPKLKRLSNGEIVLFGMYGNSSFSTLFKADGTILNNPTKYKDGGFADYDFLELQDGRIGVTFSNVNSGTNASGYSYMSFGALDISTALTLNKYIAGYPMDKLISEDEYYELVYDETNNSFKGYQTRN